MNTPPHRLARVHAALVAMTTAAAMTWGAAAAHAQSPPLPPHRPTELGAPAAAGGNAPSQAAPVTGGEAIEPPLDPDHPPMLPQASRARMSECGHEWQAIKKAGKDVDLGWREFATRCLTR